MTVYRLIIFSVAISIAVVTVLLNDFRRTLSRVGTVSNTLPNLPVNLKI